MRASESRALQQPRRRKNPNFTLDKKCQAGEAAGRAERRVVRARSILAGGRVRDSQTGARVHMEEGLVGPHESPHPADSCKSGAKTDFSAQPALVGALETRMEIVIAIELIAGAVFVLVFWRRNPELILSRRLSHRLLD